MLGVKKEGAIHKGIWALTPLSWRPELVALPLLLRVNLLCGNQAVCRVACLELVWRMYEQPLRAKYKRAWVLHAEIALAKETKTGIVLWRKAPRL